jgi:hypothetical protein
MPGDCSPSRSVVSKMRTWFGSVVLMTLGASFVEASRTGFSVVCG